MPSIKVAIRKKMHPLVMHQLWEVIIKIENPPLVQLLNKGESRFY